MISASLRGTGGSCWLALRLNYDSGACYPLAETWGAGAKPDVSDCCRVGKARRRKGGQGDDRSVNIYSGNITLSGGVPSGKPGAAKGVRCRHLPTARLTWPTQFPARAQPNPGVARLIAVSLLGQTVGNALARLVELYRQSSGGTGRGGIPGLASELRRSRWQWRGRSDGGDALPGGIVVAEGLAVIQGRL